MSFTSSLIGRVFTIILFAFASFASATCYWRDGIVAIYNGASYTACSNGNETSMCCLTSSGDKCTSQGLCESTTGLLYRNACTDPTWTSSSCSSVCPNITDTSAEVTECTNGSFCCFEDTSCCAQGRGVSVASNFSTPTSTGNYSSSSSTSTSSPSAKEDLATAWHFAIENSWLATPIIAFIGFFNTWILGSILARRKGAVSGQIADLRYTGLVKRTCAAAFLSDEYNAHPKQVIGFVTMDPGFATSLTTLETCHAGWFDFVSWAIEIGAIVYAIFLAAYIWSQDHTIKNFSVNVQFPLLLSVLNINRGTWAIAACGSFFPGEDRTRMKWLMGTTVLALAIDWLFISRAFEMAWHINETNPPRFIGILSWVLPALEGFLFFAGLWAGYERIEHIGSWFAPFIPIAIWLSLGPLFIIAISIVLHFDDTFLSSLCYPCT